MRLSPARSRLTPMFWTLFLLFLLSSLVNSFLPSPTTRISRSSALKLSLEALGTTTNTAEEATALVSTWASSGAEQLQKLSVDGLQLNEGNEWLSGLVFAFAAAGQAIEQVPLEVRVGVAVLPLLSVVTPFLQPQEPQEDLPESKPATYELSKVAIPFEFGDPAFVRPLLKQTQLERRKLRVAYDANKHGYDAKTFHQKVDGQGAAVVLAKARGRWFGGYNPRGWASLGGSRPSRAAFLFYKTLFGWQKCRVGGGGGMACGTDLFDQGIYLGADSLQIPLNGSERRAVASRLGTYYEPCPDGRMTILPGGGGNVRLQELKVLVGVYAPGEDIPNSGGVIDLGLY